MLNRSYSSVYTTCKVKNSISNRSSENALHGPAPEQKMFRDQTKATLFRDGTVPVLVQALSLVHLEFTPLNYYYYMYLVTLHGLLEKKRIVGVESPKHFSVLTLWSAGATRGYAYNMTMTMTTTKTMIMATTVTFQQKLKLTLRVDPCLCMM